MADSVQDTIRLQAIAAFSEIEVNQSSDSVQALQLWIDRFVDESTWSRCYRTLNQKKYLAKAARQTICLHKEAYSALKSFADEHDLNLSEAITQLLALEPPINKPLLQSNTNPESVSLISFEKKGEADCSLSTIIPASQLKTLNNVIPLFQDDSTSDVFSDDEQEPEFDLFGERLHWPRKPENYDYRQNESYKIYRKRINRLTIKQPDEVLMDYFYKAIQKLYYLRTDTAHRIGGDLIKLRKTLLKDKYFSKSFLPNDFAISKPISMPDYQMTGYGDEFIYFLAQILGCKHTSITSGLKEKEVFAGNRNNVHIAYKAFNYINAFLIEEAEKFLENCHKNTKKKNRLLKAGSHCDNLVRCRPWKVEDRGL